MTRTIDPDVRLLAALGDPVRLAIVRELATSAEVCACDFTACCDVRQPTVSHHLRVLREAGVVETERRGNSIFYRLVPTASGRLAALTRELAVGSGAPAGSLIPAADLVRRSRGATPASPSPLA
jgi:ArsR family transcriptional regulator